MTRAGALLFETLWFPTGGLALGNSVWGSSLITANLMAGWPPGAGRAQKGKSPDG